MNDFFTNLVDRHLGACDTIQPRLPGRFEPDRGRVAAAFSEEDTNPVVSQRDQLIDQRSEFSTEAPRVTFRESEPVGEKKDHSTSSPTAQTDSAEQLDLTEQQASFFDSHVFPGKPYNTQPSDSDRYSSQSEHRQRQPNKTASVIDRHTALGEQDVHRSFTELNELEHENYSEKASLAGEYYLATELDHRIRAMLQHLSDEHILQTTAVAHDDRSSQKNEGLITPLSEKKAQSMNVTVASPLDTAHTLEQQAGHQDKTFIPDDRKSTAVNGWLETPTWLPEIEAKFNQRLQEKEVNPEPVINVTIGRVEVRAVQTETPNKMPQPKKQSGVMMTLDEYLKRREGREAR